MGGRETIVQLMAKQLITYAVQGLEEVGTNIDMYTELKCKLVEIIMGIRNHR